MLNRIVAITFVGLLSLALADQSIAKDKFKQQENQQQLEAQKAFKKALQESGQVRVNPNPGAGPKGGTASAPRSSRK